MAVDLPPETLAILERLRAATGAGPRQLTGAVRTSPACRVSPSSNGTTAKRGASIRGLAGNRG